MENMYSQSFGRNIGNITTEEQERLKNTTIAVAGTGGVGGNALLNLARIGIGGFALADPETFAHSDINRQQGSGFDTAGHKKVEVMLKALKAINPQLRISAFPEGLTEKNVDRFLDSVSLVIDGLDFFCLKIRKRLFDTCKTKKLYLLSCPIFGFGASLAVFSPDGPSFDEYFGEIPEKIDQRYAVNFGRSFFPVFPKYINLRAYAEAMRKNQPIPSFATSCALSGAVTAAEAVFILLEKRKPLRVPYIRNYDLYNAKITVRDSRKKKMNPFQKWLTKKVFKDYVDKEFIDNL